MAASCEPRVLKHVRSRRSDSFGSIASNLTRRSSKNELYSSNTSDPGDEEDQVTLFEGQTAILSQFTAFSGFKDYENPPALNNRTSEQTLSEGALRIYKILGKSAGFLQCGKFIHPILPKLRFWRTDIYEFILPQPNPGKYWRLQLTNVVDQTFQELNDLEVLLKEICFYMNIVASENMEKELETRRANGQIDDRDLNSVPEALLKDIPEPLYHDFSDSDISRAHSPDSLSSESGEERLKLSTVNYVNSEIALKESDVELGSNPGDIPLITPVHTPLTDLSIDTSHSSYATTENVSPVQVLFESPINKDNDYTYNLAMESISSSSTLDAILDSFDLPRIADEPVIGMLKKGNVLQESEGETVVDSVPPLEPAPGSAPDIKTASPVLSDSISLAQSPTTNPPIPLASDLLSTPSDVDFSFISSEKFSKEKSPRRNFTMHPLVPLAQRTQILSSTYPLKLKSTDDRDSFMDEPTFSSFPPPSLKRSISTGYFHTVTSDLFNPSASHLIDRMDKMDRINTYSSLKGNVFNTWKPTDLRERETLWPTSGEVLDATLRSFSKERVSDKAVEPDFIQQAVVVSGYMGWRLFRRTLPGWVRR
jgi:Inheritance of peroxisomes protein 1